MKQQFVVFNTVTKRYVGKRQAPNARNVDDAKKFATSDEAATKCRELTNETGQPHSVETIYQ